MQFSIVTILSSEEDLQAMNAQKMQEKISILKCPRFWRSQTNAVNLRTNFFKGDVKYDVEWGHLYNSDCQICKRKNECNGVCKHKNLCKLYVMKIDEGVVRIKRTNVNA